MLAAEFEIDQGGNRRRAARVATSLDARLGMAARTLCKVVDISIGGVKLQTYSPLARGRKIWLTIPAVGTVRAEVMWADDFVCGCRFLQTLDQATIDSLTVHD